MPLNDMKIRCAKTEVKTYTPGDRQGLSLPGDLMEARVGGSATAMPANTK